LLALLERYSLQDLREQGFGTNSGAMEASGLEDRY